MGLVFVELDVEDFPVADADASVTALVVLVAVVAAEVAQLSVVGDGDFVNEADAEARAFEEGRGERGEGRGAGFSEAVLAECLLLGLFLLGLGLEVDDDARAGQQVFVLVEAYEYGTALGPRCAVGGARIPWQCEVVACCDDAVAVGDDALAVLLVEKEAPGGFLITT